MSKVGNYGLIILTFLQRSNGICNLGESFNESLVLSCKSHKISYICHISWSRPIYNGFNLVRVHRYTLFWDNVTQILNSISVEVTLAHFCIQLMLPEQLQCQSQIIFMFSLILRIKKNFIKGNKEQICPNTYWRNCS